MKDTSDTFSRLLAGLAAIVAFAALAVSLNQPTDLAVVQPKFPGGIYLANAGATPGAIMQANATGVPLIKFINAAGTEVANINSLGVFIGPAHGGTPTP